jgi:hypothetical protein
MRNFAFIRGESKNLVDVVATHALRIRIAAH